MNQIAMPQTRRKALIEIIPLIDIIFFLLATFVLVSMSMVKNQGVPVRLPIAATSRALDRDKGDVLIIRIAKEGTVFIDKKEVALDALAAPPEAFQKSQADPKVVIQGDTDAAYGQVIGVLDRVRKAGISKVAVQTTKKGS